MSTSSTLHPADIARAALRRLAELRLPPTPENFAQRYYATEGAPAAPVTAAAPAALASEQLDLQQRMFELFDVGVDRASSATGKIADDVAAYGKDVAASLDHLVDDAAPSNLIELLQEIAGKAAAMQQTLQASHGRAAVDSDGLGSDPQDCRAGISVDCAGVDPGGTKTGIGAGVGQSTAPQGAGQCPAGLGDRKKERRRIS